MHDRSNKLIFIKPNLPGLGSETVIFSKIDTYGDILFYLNNNKRYIIRLGFSIRP